MSDNVSLEDQFDIRLLPWKILWKKYKGTNYSSSESHRKFRAWTGVHPYVAEYIFDKYQTILDGPLPNRSVLLITLHYLKDMPSEDEGSSRFKISSRNTYRKYLWNAVDYLNIVMNEIKIENRLLSHVPSVGIFAGISLVVDATDCPIDRPTHRRERDYFSNGRHKENTYGRYNLKYTVGVQISSGEICHVMGSDGGSVADITQLREGELLAIIANWNPFEVVLADKGYQGNWKCLTAFKGRDLLPEQEAFNEVLSSVRILVECTIKRLKQFGVLGQRGRFHSHPERLDKAFNVCAQIYSNLFEARTNLAHEKLAFMTRIWQITLL